MQVVLTISDNFVRWIKTRWVHMDRKAMDVEGLLMQLDASLDLFRGDEQQNR